MLRVHSIETFGTHEGPGIRLVVFLQGCHFRCLYCHNPDTWNLTAGQEVEVSDIINRLKKEVGYFGKTGGLTVSGGEPLIQRQAIAELFSLAKEMGINTALDTNGYILDEDTKKLLEVTDLVLLDVKHINPQIHQQLTRASNFTTLRFAEYCQEINKQVWLRYVLVPGYTDQLQFLEEWAQHFFRYRNIQQVEILPYHTLGVHKYEQLHEPYHLNQVSPPDLKTIQEAEAIFNKYFKTVIIR
jgi:pyruvate formate lyase activating enzyme